MLKYLSSRCRKGNIMNIIFLDVDGVLNNIKDAEELYEKTRKPVIGYEWPFSECSLNVLKKIVDETDAKIVVTSSWRLENQGRNVLLSELKKYDLQEKVIGWTPKLKAFRREEEIIAYLNSNNYENLNFIILDDEVSWYKDLEKYVIKTDPYSGLNEEHLEKSINLLKSKAEK